MLRAIGSPTLALGTILLRRLRCGGRQQIWQTSRALTAVANRAQNTSLRPHDSSVHEPVLPSINKEPPYKRPKITIADLPTSCPGCGAPSQTVDKAAVGYYDLTSKRLFASLGEGIAKSTSQEARHRQDEIYKQALRRMAGVADLASDIKSASSPDTPMSSTVLPTCQRCHTLKHQHRGQSIIHPSMDSIQAMIEESPHDNNHIYHIIDAADFPMSLIPNLVQTLDLPRLRSKNRRSKTSRYSKGRAVDVSFIITRSDLLAPKKEQVDSLMPYLQNVLRDALGRTSQHVRLGNVRCVSARRGWWTPALKEEVWERGGAGWMVGKVNVGKSALYEAVFPKGRYQHLGSAVEPESGRSFGNRTVESDVSIEVSTSELEMKHHSSSVINNSPQPTHTETFQIQDSQDLTRVFDETSLLPAARPETMYPDMPTVSALPGTTASPIRIPYGNGRGELIDLPGIHRSSLEEYVLPEHHSKMIMKHRVVPESQTLKPGQSLLLGGLIRITPRLQPGQDMILMAYPFVPEAFAPHVTGTHKAIAVQTGVHSEMSRDRAGESYVGTITSIATEAAKKQMGSAGMFALEWDVTKRRTGPLTDRTAGKIKTDRLPFVVYSTDILIEGVGWVELSCQVRRATPARSNDTKTSSHVSSPDSHDSAFSRTSQQCHDLPLVEVISPTGQFIGSRRPMNAWELGGPKKPALNERRSRPRQSIGMKKRQASSQALKQSRNKT